MSKKYKKHRSLGQPHCVAVRYIGEQSTNQAFALQNMLFLHVIMHGPMHKCAMHNFMFDGAPMARKLRQMTSVNASGPNLVSLATL